MAATHVTHRMHAAMESAESGSKARAMTETVHRTHLTGMARANLRGALTMSGRSVFAMHRLCVLRMHRCMT